MFIFILNLNLNLHLHFFKGSLGRALSKKIKRELISSPLIDDDTLKRLEQKHKIIDVKKINTNNASVV
jgi:hypothetical protein